MPGGRPTKLTPEARELTAAYLQMCIDEKKVPVAARLAVNLGVSKSTLYKWAEVDKEFSDTLDLLQSNQEATLVEGSLENKLNPTIAKLMLSNHGYREKSDTDITSGGDKLGVSISADQAEQLIRARAKRTDI